MKRPNILKMYIKQKFRFSPSKLAIHGKVTLKNVIQGRTQADDFQKQMKIALNQIK